MASHFDTLAEVYDKLWYFSAAYQSSMVENILDLLQLGEGNVLLDIGGGTGHYTCLLKNAAGLAAAYCIEPSEKMFLEASKIPEIRAIRADATELMELDLPFEKILLKEVVHHIKARNKLWKFLAERLSGCGRILIVTRPQETELPLFEEARQAFRDNQPHCDVLREELESCGFETSLRLHPYVFQMNKNDWFDLVRVRFMSDLARFSDEEIEDGLTEVDARHPGDEIEIRDTIIFILASVKAENARSGPFEASPAVLWLDEPLALFSSGVVLKNMECLTIASLSP